MFPHINPTTTKAWNLLQQNAERLKKTHIKNLFQQDADRFKKLSFSFDDIVFDLSKNIIDDNALETLIALANECQLKEAVAAMFDGESINETENRAVLHTALRNFSGLPVNFGGKNVMEDVERVKDQMKQFSNKIHSGEWKGYTGKKIKYIVNIGIGGSDLGPYMVTEALKPYWVEGIQAYFVSNVDGTHIAETLKKINPEETLFLIASKTCTTQETMTNAHTAR